MKQTIGFWLVIAWIGLLGIPAAQAREYLVNQDYYTAERGEVEVEFYNDLNLPEVDHNDTYHSKHQIEFEYGVTDRLQVAYYEVYTWDRTDDWERDAFKIEAKWRLKEAGQWPVDVALYTEYQNPDGRHQVKSDAFENKLILNKTIGPWNLVGNFIFEKKIFAEEPWEYEYTAGVSYNITSATRLLFEVKQGLGDSHDFGFSDDRELLIVPGISTHLSEHLCLLVGSAIGLTETSDDLQLRSILEVEF